jgi:hypothetical protein
VDAEQVGRDGKQGIVAEVGDGSVHGPGEHGARSEQTDANDDGDHQQHAPDGTVAAVEGFLAR